MTPRTAGPLAGVVAFAVLAALHAAVVVLQNTSEPGSAGGLGEFLLWILIGVIPLSVGAGLFVAVVVRTSRGRRAAISAALGAYVLVGVWTYWRSLSSPRTDGEDPLEYALELVESFAATATTFALAAAVTAWWIAGHAVGRDSPERLLTLETASLRGSRERWGTAMRAELASIDDSAERDRFARSAGMFALRRGTGWWPLALAAVAGLGTVVVVFLSARISFERTQGRGIIGEPLMGIVPLLLVLAVIAGTLIGRSFRAGLETAGFAWIAVYLCTLAVEVPQALAWYREGGIFLLDGDPASRVDALGAALEPVTHGPFIVMAVAQLVVAVLAAALGMAVLEVARRFGMLRPIEAEPGSRQPSPI